MLSGRASGAAKRMKQGDKDHLDGPSQRLSYWQQEGGAAAPTAAGERPGDTDIAIIGGGLAGVSTAIAILQRQPGARVIVLESQFVGFGASGRNGGLLSPLPAPVWLLTAAANPDHAWALRALNARVHALGAGLEATVPESETTPCTLQLQAVGRLTTSGLAKVAATLARAGIGYALAADAERGGKPTLELPSYMVHPYRLVRALAAHASSLGTRIYEGVEVGAVKATPGGAVVYLAQGGYLRARKVVMCTNAFTASIAAPSTPRAKVVRNHMIATQPLDEQAVQRLGGGEAFRVELNKSHVFYRLHQGRLVYGGAEASFRTPKSDHDVPASVRKALARHLGKSVPWCNNLEIATDWGGAYHSTATGLPIVRRAADAGAVIFNVGYGGAGVALTHIFAPHAAALALDLPLSDDDARLGEIVRGTRMPIKSLLQFGADVALDVAKALAGAKR